MSAPHDRPTMLEIVQAVQQWWSHAATQPASSRRTFDIQVAVNALDIVQRELLNFARQRSAHRSRLAGLGHTDDRSLANAIRSGAHDDNLEELAAVLRESIHDKVAVANPRWLQSDPLPPHQSAPQNAAAPHSAAAPPTE
ncbi:MAG: DUF6285 domain-containing protein [Actinomycetota bacterium]